MKKLYLAVLPLLVACSNTSKLPSLQELTGEWICTTEYKGLNVGTVDFLTLNADGTMKDDSYIFDHIFSSVLGKQVEDYFQSPLKYIQVAEGKWALSGKALNYNLKINNFKRLIWPNVFSKIQEDELLKKMELEVFKIYSSPEEGEIELNFKKFIKNGFVVEQNLSGKTYESICLNKSVSKYNYLEAYKQIHKVK